MACVRYNRFLLRLRNDLHLIRKVWHMGMGFFMVWLYWSGLSRTTSVLLLTLGFGVFMCGEILRLRWPAFNRFAIRYMGVLMRDSEVNRMTGTTYYIAAVALAIGIFPKTIAILSILYLAFGDPIASVAGIMYGDRSIRFKNGKSLIGTLAGVCVCALITVLVLRSSNLSFTQTLWITVCGGLAGGAAEMLPLDVDDNFSIPLVAGFALWLVFILAGA